MGNLIQSLQASMVQFFSQIASFLPKLMGALFILIIGWFIARIVRMVVKRLLKMVKIDSLSDKIGLNDMMKKGDFKLTLSSLLAKMVYWMIMLVVIMTSLNSLDLTAIQGLFNKIILYIPNVFVAVIIMILGMYASKVASSALAGVLKNMNIENVDLFEKVVKIAIMVFTIFIAVHQLQIAQKLIETIFSLLIGSMAIAVGVAFGLGGKDMAADFLKKLKK